MTADTGRRAPHIVVSASDAATQPDPGLAARKTRLYAAALERQGAVAFVLDPSTRPAERRRLLDSMDGLVLAGGADIHPARFGAAGRGARATEPDRDELEAEAWSAAEARSVPVLGICRGLQAINVFLGGRLLQDVGGHMGAPYGSGPALRHELRLVPGTRLAAILAGPSEASALAAIEVNSYHHQAIRAVDLAPRLIAAAWASSDAGELVEGLELPGPRFVVAVQCHPERTESTPPTFETLWASFVAAASRQDVEVAPRGIRGATSIAGPDRGGGDGQSPERRIGGPMR